MIAPIRREPLEPMQDGVIGTYDFRTGKIKYPQPFPVGGEIEPYPSIMGGEVKPPFVSTMPYFGGGKMETIGPYIPSDDNQGIELFGGGTRMAGDFGDLKDYEKKILQDGLKIRKGHPSYDAEKLRLIRQYPGFQALIPRDDELGDIIRQQDRDIFDEYRRIDGENPDPFGPLPIRKAGKFINDLMA
tara:strand:- start:22 stop:582 length:561 start_codon:yes stop_codon:yes gene_type:complete